ncbi:MAG: uracil-DNA glycosylase [Kiritimatiellaeota bacterium]|nr:uracil-DNA glycosylase [Kiritimatiellota bacterium]
MSVSPQLLTGLARTLEHEILAGRRFAPIDPEVARGFVAAMSGAGAPPKRPQVENISPAETPPPAPAIPATAPAAVDDTARESVRLETCDACPCHGAAPPVFGVGRRDAPDYMFVCEYPASGADVCGGLFAKADFELLEKILKAMGTDAASVFMTAAIKCRPPNKTAADEAAPCGKWLAEQVDEIKPKCIVAMGDYALRLMAGQSTLSVMNEHGKLRKYKGVPYVPTYSPAYINKFPDVKKDAWKDLKMAMAQV